MLDCRGLNTDELDVFDLCLDLWLDKLGGLCDFDDMIPPPSASEARKVETPVKVFFPTVSGRQDLYLRESV